MVVVEFSEGDESVRIDAHRGVRQGDIVRPDLFNIFMAAIFLTWKKKKRTMKVKVFCDSFLTKDDFS